MPTLEDVEPAPARCSPARPPARRCPSTRPSPPARAAPGDPDGPDEYHVVILDNGRSSLLGTEFQEMLRCIRCGACMNHCPVYQAVGGHAYGWVYPGPMGAVLDAEPDRHRQDAAPAQRLDLLRPLRERLPDEDPAAEADAALARARVRAAPVAGDGALRPQAVGLLRPASRALRRGDAARRWRGSPLPAARAGASAACRWRAAGRRRAIFPRPRAAPSRCNGGASAARGAPHDERPRRHPRHGAPLARRHRPRADAPRHRRRAPATRAEGSDPGARPARRRRA